MTKRSPYQTAVIVVYVVSMFLVAMDATILNVALSSIAKEYGVPASATGTVNIGYLVSLAMVLPAAGWLGDRFGTKRIFMIALGLFTFASVGCGLSDSFMTLNLFRVIQGAGAGMITPVAMAILFRTFSPKERPKLSRMLVVPIALAPALGPVLGGFLVDGLSWHWIFFINAPVGIAALFLCYRWLEEYHTPDVGAFDKKGFFLSLPAFSFLVYAFTKGPEVGWGSPWILFLVGAGLVLLGLFLRQEWTMKSPMLDLQLMKDPEFRTMSLIGFGSAAGLFGMLFVFPLMYQRAFGVSALETGLTIFPEALGLMVASQMLPWSMKKFGVRRLVTWSLFGSFIVFTLIALTVEANPWITRVLMFNVGIFLGHAVTAAQITAFKNIPKPSMARATTFYNVQKRFGAIVGVSALASILGTSEAVELSVFQVALFGAALFLFLCFLVMLTYKETTSVAGASSGSSPAKAANG